MGNSDEGVLHALFSEELGAVIQVRRSDREKVLARLAAMGLGYVAHIIGHPRLDGHIVFQGHEQLLFDEHVQSLQQVWAETSYRMQALRDNLGCADEAFKAVANRDDKGLFAELTFAPSDDICAPFIGGSQPKMAVLREQGVNGQVEMAAAFDRAGFDCVDLHMSDIISGRTTLEDFRGLVACGGFSFGDVLGAGRGWANSVMFNACARDQFDAFFHRDDTFALGVCNGCQMMSNLKTIIPGAENWPSFERNRSEQFEARLLQVEVLDSPSIFFGGMEGSKLPLVVAHGEGRAEFIDDKQLANSIASVRYINSSGHAAESYPHNPNGSPGGLTGFTTEDGRFTIMMPHPERLFRSLQYSWKPDGWGEDGPWMRMFRNARKWVA